MLVEIYRSDSTAQAQLTAEVLKQHGLQPTLTGEGLASLVGMGGFALPCRILIPQSQVDEAREVLSALKAEQDTPTPANEPTNCPACGADWEPGFEACWSCQTFYEEPT